MKRVPSTKEESEELSRRGGRGCTTNCNCTVSASTASASSASATSSDAYPNSNKENRAKGSMIGAALGDAIGALLEWSVGPLDDNILKWALSFGDGKGGGPHCLAPGQITDDTEQHISLARGILMSNESNLSEALSVLDMNKVAREYSRWRWGGQAGNRRVEPFDVGKASGNAFGACASYERCSVPGCPYGSKCYFSHHVDQKSEEQSEWARTMYQAASEFNQLTKSNGSLMRCMPLAVWGHRLTVDQLAQCVKLDCQLSHPNASCIHATASYVICCACLIRTGNSEEALETARDWVETNANEDVKGWMREALLGEDPIPFRCDTLDDGSKSTDGSIAFARWAYGNAFRQLKTFSRLSKELPVDLPDDRSLTQLYIDLITEVLRGGGDTDTNTAICSALLGAAVGYDRLPMDLVKTLLDCDTALNTADPGVPRPDFLHPSLLLQYSVDLCQGAPQPDELKIITGLES